MSVWGMGVLVASTAVQAQTSADVPRSNAPPAGDDDGNDHGNETDEFELPLELPPLGDDLDALLSPLAGEGLAHMLEGVELFGYGRMRLELDEGRDLALEPSFAAGLALTGRIGIGLPIGPHRARLVLGEGQRFGPPIEPAPAAPSSFPLRALGLIYELSLTFDFPTLGMNTLFVFGRQEFFIADERWIGRAQPQARQRTFDGISASTTANNITTRAGLFFLGPLAPDDLADPSGFLVASAAYDFDHDFSQSPWLHFRSAATGYGFAHRDGTPARFDLEPLTAFTAGMRAQAGLAFVTAKLGLDAQVPVRDVAPLTPPGYGGHVEGELTFAPQLSIFSLRGAPFFSAFAEATGGVPTAGRIFRQPGGSVHPFLGDLDLLLPDNVASAGARMGLALPDLIQLSISGTLYAMLDPTGALIAPGGRFWLERDPRREERVAFSEVDARLLVELGYGVQFLAAYAIALPGPALGGSLQPIQRLWLALDFSAGI